MNRGNIDQSNEHLNPLGGLPLRQDLRGKRYINQLRCSNVSQTDTSPEGQKHVNDLFAHACGMQWAGEDFYAEGVSGSQTFNRADLEAILERKRTRNDFDVVVVFELGRMTRGGISHGNSLDEQFKEAGIEIISSTEMIPEGPIGELIKSVKHFSNQQQAINISKSVARGLGLSLQKAMRPGASRTNYGLDRLYVGPNNEPRVLIRWEGNMQLRLDPATKQILSKVVRPPQRKQRKYGEQRVKRDRFLGYQKQPDERALHVPGSPQAHDAVCQIWRMRYCQNMGARRIINYLRSQGIPSPSGGEWNTTAIHYIVENPIYLGIEVRQRVTRSLYHKISQQGPMPVNLNQAELRREKRVAVPQRDRPRDEWELVDRPELKDFLPADVRKIAMPRVMALLEADAIEQRKLLRKSKQANKHTDKSEHVLSHILHSKQTGRPMAGQSTIKTTRNGKQVFRYYYDGSAVSNVLSGASGRRVRAEALEDAVVNCVFESLRDTDWVGKCIRNQMNFETQGPKDLGQLRKDLEAEKDVVLRRLRRIHATSDGLTDAELESLVADDNKRLIAIRQELIQLDCDVDHRPPTSDEAVTAVTAALAALPTSWRDLPKAELKSFLSAVIDKLEIDLETFEVTFSLRIPKEAAFSSEQPSGVRLNSRLPWQSSLGTNPQNGLILDNIQCDHDQKTKCHTCHRPRKAA